MIHWGSFNWFDLGSSLSAAAEMWPWPHDPISLPVRLYVSSGEMAAMAAASGPCVRARATSSHCLFPAWAEARGMHNGPFALLKDPRRGPVLTVCKWASPAIKRRHRSGNRCVHLAALPRVHNGFSQHGRTHTQATRTRACSLTASRPCGSTFDVTWHVYSLSWHLQYG